LHLGLITDMSLTKFDMPQLFWEEMFTWNINTVQLLNNGGILG